MVEKYPFISIIVPTRNEEKAIKECIDSLLKVNYPKNKYEIIISDGMSTDKTREIVKNYGKKVKLIDNRGINSATGRNIALKKARGKIIAFTDADCEVPKNWLKALIKELEPATVVGGPNLPPKKSPYFARAVSYALGTFFGSAGSAQGYVFKKKTEVKSLPNANAMYWKKDILKVGGYDKTFVTGQDGELNYRLGKKGVKFYFIPEIKVLHKMRPTPATFARRMFQYGFAQAKFKQKHGRPLNPLYVLMPFFPVFAIFTPVFIYWNWLGIGIAAILMWSVYFLLGLGYAFSTRKPGYIGRIMTVFLIEHFFYGLGFLYGMLK